jgi:hypothetical protein
MPFLTYVSLARGIPSANFAAFGVQEVFFFLESLNFFNFSSFGLPGYVTKRLPAEFHFLGTSQQKIVVLSCQNCYRSKEG